MINQNIIKLGLLILGVVMLMFPELALAAGPFTPSDGDKSKEIFIDYLFGPISGGDSGSNPLGPIIEAFNKSILFIGGILVAYTLIAGTMSTAHDGEMLGKKWSSMWIPIRTALGAASIFPILPGGFAFAQAIVVWLALQGVGLADTLVNKFVDSDHLAGNIFYEPPSIQAPIRSFLENMLISNACNAAISGSVELHDDKTKSLFELDKDFIAGVTQGTTSDLIVHYGVVTAYPTAKTPLCGSTTFLLPKSVDGMDGAEASVPGLFNSDRFASQLQETHIEQFTKSQNELAKLGQKINGEHVGDEMQKEVTATLDRLALEWSNAAREKGKSVMEENTNREVIEKIKNDGWLLLGAWYLEIAKAQDAVTKGVTTIPNGHLPSIIEVVDEDDGAFTSFLKRAKNKINSGLTSAVIGQEVEAVIAKAIDYSQGSASGPGGAVQDLADTSTNTWTAKIVSWFVHGNENGFYGGEIGTNLRENPVIMARNLGQNMTTTGWAAYGIAAAAAISAGGGVSGVGATLSSMITGMAGTIIVAGATLSTYIPMLPYILWIGVALGWAILLVEAVIAAPLWAVTHLAPDADGVVGRGGQGYMLVLSLTLRPALMVIGFAAAVTLMNPLGLLINSTFIGAFLTGVNPSIYGVTQMIMGCVLYAVVMISVITRVFALIHVIPDRILRWIGGGSANELGQEAHGIESHTGAKVMAGAAVSQQLGQGFAEGVRGARQNKLANRGNATNRLSAASQEEGNAGDKVRGAEAGLAAAMEDLRHSPNDPGAQENVKAKSDEVVSARFDQAVAKAEVAKARGAVYGATTQEKADAASAASFLKEASRVPRDSKSKADFMRSNAGKYAGKTWGESMASAGITSSLASSRANSRASASDSNETPQKAQSTLPEDGDAKDKDNSANVGEAKQGDLFDNDGNANPDANPPVQGDLFGREGNRDINKDDEE